LTIPQVTSEETAAGVAEAVVAAVVSVAGVVEVVGVLVSPPEPPPQADSSNAENQTQRQAAIFLRNITKTFSKSWLLQGKSHKMRKP
jgi:hypothetical protein